MDVLSTDRKVKKNGQGQVDKKNRFNTHTIKCVQQLLRKEPLKAIIPCRSFLSIFLFGEGIVNATRAVPLENCFSNISY